MKDHGRLYILVCVLILGASLGISPLSAAKDVRSNYIKVDPFTISLIQNDEIVGFYQFALELEVKDLTHFSSVSLQTYRFRDTIIRHLYNTLRIDLLFKGTIDVPDLKSRLQKMADHFFGDGKVRLLIIRQNLQMVSE